jgi:3-deoxy-7-phosphoheptulonate synthase
VTTDDIRDRRITGVQPLLSPATLRRRLPLSRAAHDTVVAGRAAVSRILDGTERRLLAVVGPCSIHDPAAALDYASRLSSLAVELAPQLCIVMRTYFEKPRTTLGWKGLVNDPGLDGRFDVNEGLRLARALLLDVLELGLPVGVEFLDPITPQYLSDAVSWGSIGARTSQSQIHRQLASGLSMPIGIKNGTDGDVQAAVDAVAAAASGHVFPGIDDRGRAAVLTTAGNPDGHVVLRGGATTTNHDAASIRDAMARLERAGLAPRVVVDASHGNSGKRHERQTGVVRDVARQVASGERGIVGVMLESFLVAGRQDLVLGRAEELRYGQSVTDACLGWDETVVALRELAGAVEANAVEANAAQPARR